MPKRKDPKELREEAKRLLEKAERIERERYIRLGKITMKYLKNNFTDFSLETFRNELTEALSNE